MHYIIIYMLYTIQICIVQNNKICIQNYNMIIYYIANNKIHYINYVK